MTARHVVLVPEAGADEDGFAALAAWLTRLGWTVHEPRLPAGLDEGPVESVARVRAVVGGLEGAVVLLGHGSGGRVAAVVAEQVPERIAVLVLLAAVVPDPVSDEGPDEGPGSAPASEGLGAVRCIYVETRRDEVLPLDEQRRLQRLVPGAMRLTIDSGHWPQLTMAEHLAGDLHAAVTTELRRYVVRHDLRRV